MSHQPPRTTTLSDAVQDSLYRVRSQLLNFRFTHGLLRFFIITSLVLFATGAVDYFWPQPAWVRGLTWIGLLGFATVFLIRWIKNNHEIDELLAAKEMEAVHPELGQRIRTAYQFDSPTRPSPQPQLTTALIEDVNRRAEQVDFSDTVNWFKLLPSAAAIGVISISIIAALVVWSETRTTLARLLMFPTHYTQLEVAKMESVVAGADAEFKATVKGRPLEQVELWVRALDDSNGWTKYQMQPVVLADESGKVSGELTARVEKCDKDLRYKVVGHPVSSSAFRLKVLQPLTQQRFVASVEPPTYTGLDKQSVEEMDITVVEGSLVAWHMELNREPVEAELVATRDSKTPLPKIVIEGRKLVCDVSQLEESQQYEVRASAEDGMKFSSDRIRIRVTKDNGPTVAFQKPKDQLEVTATTEVGLQLNVSDDFGLGKVGIEYQINGGERLTLWEDDLTGQAKKGLATLPVMYLENHELGIDDAITYYAFAEDNREQPKRTRSELQFIDIRPYKREYQVVDGQCKGGGSCLSLEELIARQRHNLRRTFANLDRQPIQDTLSKRLSTSQAEIMQATREFTAGWEAKFGPMPSLHTASTAMEGAAEHLRNKQLDPAMPLEETALADLVKARQNARKFLKQCSSGQFGQCKKYDNEMVQKLRAPAKQQAETEKSLAETRDNVQKMAARQRRFSEEITTGGGGAALDKKSPSQQSPQPGQKNAAASSSSSQSLTQAQQSAAEEARRMQADLLKNQVATELAQQRMEEVADKIQESAQRMAADDRVAAAKQALESAKLLDELDQQLNALGSADLSERLGLAEQMASQLTIGENKVSDELERAADLAVSQRDELADTQRELATKTDTLADLIQHLEADALGENQELRRGLGELKNVHRPDELARDMDRVALEIDQASNRAAPHARAAADGLGMIAAELGNLRRGILQPQLEQLLLTEAKVAGLLQAIQDGKEQAELAAQYEQLQRQLANLNISAPSAGKAEPGTGSRSGGAVRGTNSSSQQGSAGSVGGTNQSALGSGGGGTTQPQFRYAGRNVSAELRQVMDTLQSKIQDAILLTARMDADEPVPAKYQGLVDQYYQALSDDLR